MADIKRATLIAASPFMRTSRPGTFAVLKLARGRTGSPSDLSFLGLRLAQVVLRDHKNPQRMIIAFDRAHTERLERDAVIHGFGDIRVEQDLRVARQVAEP